MSSDRAAASDVAAADPPAHAAGHGLNVFPVLLTATAGALDATTFLGLGSVFASVMTGNLVLLGLAAGKTDSALAIASGIALGGYVAGTLAGAAIATRANAEWEVPARSEPEISRQPPDGRRTSTTSTPSATRQPAARPSEPTGRLTTGLLIAFAVELLVIVGFAVFWEAVGARPSLVEQHGLLVLAAGAMGMQSAAVRQFGSAGFSTTYLTGTLTGLVSALAAPAHSRAVDWWAACRLLGLVAGAGVAAVLVDQVPRAAPAVPLGVGASALAVAWTVHNRTAGRPRS